MKHRREPTFSLDDERGDDYSHIHRLKGDPARRSLDDAPWIHRIRGSPYKDINDTMLEINDTHRTEEEPR